MAKKRGATRVLRPTLYVLLVFSSVLLFQCKDDENPDVEVSITADKTTVTFPATGGNYEVKITSSGDWNVKEKIDWLAATKVNNTLLKVTCEENTGAERSDKVTATIEEESVEITVTQSAAPSVTLSAESLTVTASSTSNATITMTSNVAWKSSITSSGDWITSVTPATGTADPGNAQTLTLAYEANATTAARMGTITFTETNTDGSALTERTATTTTLTVTQEAAEPSVTLSAASLTVTASSTSNATITMTSNVAWAATESEDWITSVTPATGTADPDNAQTLTLAYEAHAMAAERMGTITFTETNTDGSALTEGTATTTTLTVTQEAAASSITLSAASLTVTASSTSNVTITITSNVAWEATESEDWITSVTPATGTADPGNAQPLTLAYDAHATAAERMGTITFTETNTDGSAVTGRTAMTTTFTITQEAAEPSVTLNSESLSVTASSTSNATITITSNVAWKSSIPSSDDWITSVTPAKGTADPGNAQTLTLAYEANATTAARMGTITFTETNTDGSAVTGRTAATTTLAVTQSAVPVPPGLIPVSTLEQLNAIRYDLNGDGKVDDAGGLTNIAAAETEYAAVFPRVAYNANDTDKYTGYKLENNLDFTVDASYSNATTNKSKWTPNSATPTNAGWAPIGFYNSDTDNAAFRGAFDGQGKTISNLFINRGSTYDVGLFGYIRSGSVKNVGLKDPVVTGSNRVGSLVGWNDRGTISAFYVSGGTVTGTGSLGSAGGLVGHNASGPISASYVSGVTVTGHGRVGGLVGWNDRGTINACYAGGKNYAKLVGGGSATKNSYYQAATVPENNDRAKTGSQLRTPTVANGIYAEWTATQWDFGGASDYPRLKADFNGDNTATVAEFGDQTITFTPPTVSFTQATHTVTEGLTVDITVRVSEAPGEGLTYSIPIVEGSGTTAQTTDYALTLPTSVDISDSDTEVTFSIMIKVDATADAGEKLVLAFEDMLSDKVSLNAGSTATTQITINEAPNTLPAVEFSSTTYSAAEGTVLTVTVEVSAAPGAGLKYVIPVEVLTAGSTAQAADYLLSSSNKSIVTISGTETSKTFDVILWGDDASDNGETIKLGFDMPAAIGLRAGTKATTLITINNASPLATGLISITNLEQLNAIRYDLDGDGEPDEGTDFTSKALYIDLFPALAPSDITYSGYKLMQDVDFDVTGSYASGSVDQNWSEGEDGSGWEPIGFYNSNTGQNVLFTGTFDGQGNTISNLFINRGSTGNAGLFGVVGSGGSVKNVELDDPVVTGNWNVGGLVGRNSGTVSACYVSGGTVTGRNTVGDLVGWNNTGTISASYVSGGTVTGTGDFVGGLVGGNDNNSTISVSYVSGGAVTGNDDVGGLVGWNGNSSTIIASYVSGGTVTGDGDVGGLVGWSNGTINASYAGGKDFDNLVGSQEGTVTNSYHQLASGGTENATSKFEATLKTPTAYGTPPNNIYKDWNVNVDGQAGGDDPWDFGTNAQYPVLKGVDADGDGNVDADDITAQRN